MNHAIRRQALQTTAKVALSLTVLACGGTVEVAQEAPAQTDPPPDPPEPIDEEQGERLPSQASFPEEEEPLACDAAPVGEEVTILDDEQLGCCLDQLEPVWPAEGPDGWEQWQETMQDEDVGACCNVVVAHADQATTFDLFETLGWDKIQRCCEAAGSPVGPACTPWGPPVPPHLRGVMPLSLDALEIA